MADGEIIIDVVLDDGSVAQGVANIDKSLGGIGDAAQKASISIGKIATALGLVALARKGIELVRDSLDGAFNRIDTMEQFQRVMGVMVDDTDAVGASLSRLEDITKGTSMRMDVMADGVQNFVTRGMDIDKATDTMESWGNAVAFYGDGSNEQFQNVTDALQNMVSKGTVGMDQLNRITEAGIPAVELYADATGKSTEEVSKALSEGEISAEQFVDTVSTAMMEGTEKFPEISNAMKDEGASWGSIMENIGAYVEIGVTDIITAIDDMLESNGLPDMRTMIDEFAQSFGESLSNLAEKIPEVVEKIQDWWEKMEPIQPLLVSIAKGVGLVVGAIATFGTAVTIINTVRKAMQLMNMTALMNPWALLAAAAVAAVLLIIEYWEPISEFFIEIWSKIKEFGLEIWEILKESWVETVDFLKELWLTVIEFFAELWSSIREVFSEAYEFLNEITDGFFGQFVELVQSYLTTAWEIIQLIWSFIKDTFSNTLEFLKALVTGDFQGMKDAISKQMENAKNLLSNIWSTIKSNTGAKLREILSKVKNKFIEIKNNIKEKITQSKDALVHKFTEMVTNARKKTTEIWTTIKRKFQDIVDSVKEKMENALDKVKGIGEDILGFFEGLDLYESGKAIIQSAIDGVVAMKDKIVGKVEGIVSSIRDLWPFSPAKTGPLSDIHKMDFASPIGKSIDKAKKPLLGTMGGLTDELRDEIEPNISLNRLRGAKPSLGIVGQPVSSNVVHAEKRSRSQKEPITIVVKPSNVEMDGRTVGEITWEVVDENIERNKGILDRFRR